MSGFFPRSNSPEVGRVNEEIDTKPFQEWICLLALIQLIWLKRSKLSTVDKDCYSFYFATLVVYIGSRGNEQRFIQLITPVRWEVTKVNHVYVRWFVEMKKPHACMIKEAGRSVGKLRDLSANIKIKCSLVWSCGHDESWFWTENEEVL